MRSPKIPAELFLHASFEGTDSRLNETVAFQEDIDTTGEEAHRELAAQREGGLLAV